MPSAKVHQLQSGYPANAPLPRIAVLMLGYKDRDHLRVALASVLDQDYGSFDCTFIDGSSRDGSADLVREHFPSVSVIELVDNRGYAGSYAQVVPEVFDAGYDAVVLINCDVRVDRSWLRELVSSAYSRDDIGFAQPKILLWGTDRLNSFGNAVNLLGFGFCKHCDAPDAAAFGEDRDVAYTSGACMLVKREAYRDVGGLDESFFCYVEDQDLVWRGRMLGWAAVVSARSRMWHKYKFIDVSRAPHKVYWYERNRLTFMLKNYGLILLVSVCPVWCLTEIGLVIHAIAAGYFRSKARAYADLLVRLLPLLRSRRQVQARRVLGDRDLVGWLSPIIEFPEGQGGIGLRMANLLLSAYFRALRLAWPKLGCQSKSEP